MYVRYLDAIQLAPQKPDHQARWNHERVLSSERVRWGGQVVPTLEVSAADPASWVGRVLPPSEAPVIRGGAEGGVAALQSPPQTLIRSGMPPSGC